MKKVMNLSEFRRYCEGRSISRIEFCTENQPSDFFGNPIRMYMSFSSLMVSCNPNTICLKEGENSVCLVRVKSVLVDTERPVAGTVATVLCGSKKFSGFDCSIKLLIL